MYVNGTCHCGRIAFEAEVDPDKISLCHCSDCQKLSGTAFRTVVPAAAATFRLLSGAPKMYVKTAESGNRRAHAFCSDCGTPIWSGAVENPPSYSLRLGTLEQRHQLKPTRQIWFKSSLAWVTALAGLPKSERQ